MNAFHSVWNFLGTTNVTLTVTFDPKLSSFFITLSVIHHISHVDQFTRKTVPGATQVIIVYM